MTNIKGDASGAGDVCWHKQWDEISCPICMDHPHNAVLLLCSSHDKGCRTYICDTSYRHSNCLDRYKKSNLEIKNDTPLTGISIHENPDGESHEEWRLQSLTSESTFDEEGTSSDLMDIHENHDLEESGFHISTGLEGSSHQSNNRMVNQDETAIECKGSLKCPLCRGSVLGWKVIKEARQYLDLKRRNCSRESCSFSGNYAELRRHARRIHPTTRPADVDPSRRRAWRHLEHQREYGDILSAIRSAMPGAVVLGDYVIDNGDGLSSQDRELTGPADASSPWWTTFFLFHMISGPLRSLGDSRRSSRAWRRHRRSSRNRTLWGENLLGLHDNENEDRNLSPRDPIPRRRRRFSRSDPELP